MCLARRHDHWRPPLRGQQPPGGRAAEHGGGGTGAGAKGSPPLRPWRLGGGRAGPPGAGQRCRQSRWLPEEKEAEEEGGESGGRRRISSLFNLRLLGHGLGGEAEGEPRPRLPGPLHGEGARRRGRTPRRGPLRRPLHGEGAPWRRWLRRLR